jgi:lauroyl/myristoyl acyltransferase
MSALSLDGWLWRRLAHWGSSRGPEWFVRIAPTVVGVAVCALSRRRRAAIVRNLRKVRGRRGPIRDSVDVARTFANYAACLAEVLGARLDETSPSETLVSGASHLREALAEGRGVLVVTAHAGAWESAGALLSRNFGLPVMIVEQAERDAGAQAIQDEARRQKGLRVVHVGEDPLSALPLVRHLRERGVVALQMDRVPVGKRARHVTMFGENAHVPEGPLRLAALTGAPVVPVFAARQGHRRHEVFVGPSIRLTRSSGEAELDAAAQKLADALSGFVRSHPTQWFHFSAE